MPSLVTDPDFSHEQALIQSTEELIRTSRELLEMLKERSTISPQERASYAKALAERPPAGWTEEMQRQRLYKMFR
jgi:hypothetical protein